MKKAKKKVAVRRSLPRCLPQQNVLDGGRLALATKAINSVLCLLPANEARHVVHRVLPRHWEKDND